MSVVFLQTVSTQVTGVKNKIHPTRGQEEWV